MGSDAMGTSKPVADEANDGTSRMVRADEIHWTLEPQPQIETVDLLMLNDEEIVRHASDLQRELKSMRMLLHEALATIARLTAQLERARPEAPEAR